MIGYVFDGGWAAKNIAPSRASSRPPPRPRRSSPPLTPNGSGSRRASASPTRPALEIYRKRYSEGIPRRPVADEESRRPRALSACSPSSAAPKLVGTAKELDPGTFYDPGKAD